MSGQNYKFIFNHQSINHEKQCSMMKIRKKVRNFIKI